MAKAARMASVLAAALAVTARLASAEAGRPTSRNERFSLRGHPQTLRLYGTRGGPVAIVTSGDGGWVHLGPDVAQSLAGEGWFVVGFDAKAYLSSFTGGGTTLSVADVPRDYATLAGYAALGGPARPLLFGVSEGAGLSVLAAGFPEVQGRIAGVVALGLPDKNELGWRFRDSVIYMTKKTPNEPLFSVRECVSRVSPVPLAIFRSTGDEFVTEATTEAIWAQAREPRKLWTIVAADHRFSDKQPELRRGLKDAIAWILQQQTDASR